MGKTVKWQNMKGEQSCPDQTSTPLKPARSTAWPAFLGLPGFRRREPGVLQENEQKANRQAASCALRGIKPKSLLSAL